MFFLFCYYNSYVGVTIDNSSIIYGVTMKMCLRVDATGYGDGEGTHMSAFVHLMRGVFQMTIPRSCYCWNTEPVGRQ